MAEGVSLNQLQITSNFKTAIQKAQQEDEELQKMLKSLGQGKQGEIKKDREGIWRYKERICVPNVGSLRHELLTEAHKAIRDSIMEMGRNHYGLCDKLTKNKDGV
ncbi:hypothetical protein PIB30_066411 [Stylosanthes scabra]|uniref:Uncharacterized protein n=1 Tax=Stylosanthes scabra TaxID=79078 RepID=A0ABU6RN43_9FABA|nr:hypothetical protein [Stylosanthes scabra]